MRTHNYYILHTNLSSTNAEATCTAHVKYKLMCLKLACAINVVVQLVNWQRFRVATGHRNRVARVTPTEYIENWKPVWILRIWHFMHTPKMINTRRSMGETLQFLRYVVLVLRHQIMKLCYKIMFKSHNRICIVWSWAHILLSKC